MHELIRDAENDSKSTAGDKHETGRAMMQIAREQLGKQLLEAEMKRSALSRIEGQLIHERVKEGSIVTTNENIIFIAAPIGKIKFDGKDIFVISAQSPLGKTLLRKGAGENVSFNQRNITILQVQ
jgi:transcription elongation GreA/GreB family factor